MTPEREARFWLKVDTDSHPESCWLWKGSVDDCGYGMFGIKPSRCERAHRVSWRILKGDIPEGMCVLHRCDTPGCVRPDHLFLGARADNMRDRQLKLRQARGETSGRARLTAAAVRDARARRSGGEMVKDLASTYGVADCTMSAALSGRTWSHV